MLVYILRKDLPVGMLDPANPWKFKKKTEGRTSMFIKKQEPSEMFLFDPDRGNESKMERLIREMSEDFICSKLAPWKICTRFIMRKGKFFCSDVRGLLGWDTVKSAGFLDLRPCKPVL